MTSTQLQSTVRVLGSVVAIVFGIVTILAGSRVLLGTDPGYVVFRPLLIYNTVMGALYVAAGVTIWSSAQRGKHAAAAIFTLNLLVLIGIAIAYRTGDAVAIDSVQAMTLRTVVWLAIFLSVAWRVRVPAAIGRTALVALLVGAAASCTDKEEATPATMEQSAQAVMPAHGSPPLDPDERTALILPAMGRHLVLSEMRVMLTSVQEFVAAAARGDTAAMRTAATASGVAAARDLDPAMQQRLPAEFLRLGMSTHTAWDSLALDVASGSTTNQALARLGVIMSNCVACHEQFRIAIEP